MERMVIVRGGGDLATGVIYRLFHAGFKVACLEVAMPTVVRRTVSAAQAVFEGHAQVEDVAFKLMSLGEFPKDQCTVPVWIDPKGDSINQIKPHFVVDAIMAKRNTGTHMSMAPCVIALGPGFIAGKDVHYVIETKRGHYLGRVITRGGAIPDTGVPGVIGVESINRLLRAPNRGYLRPFKEIGDLVEAGEMVGEVNGVPVVAAIKGVLRGIIHPRVPLVEGMKIGDVDPRCIREHCFTISDKALAIAGGVLEAMLRVR